MSFDLRQIVNKVEVVLLELSQLTLSGVRFRVVHRFRCVGTDGCASGEEIAAVYLIHRNKEFYVRLSLTLRLLFDYLAARRHLPQSAGQIIAGMRTTRFYREHGSNITGGDWQTKTISRPSVKEYVKRIRRALDIAFKEAEIHLQSENILVSDQTVTNEVAYRLKANVEWDHVEDLQE